MFWNILLYLEVFFCKTPSFLWSFEYMNISQGVIYAGGLPLLSFSRVGLCAGVGRILSCLVLLAKLKLQSKVCYHIL